MSSCFVPLRITNKPAGLPNRSSVTTSSNSWSCGGKTGPSIGLSTTDFSGSRSRTPASSSAGSCRTDLPGLVFRADQVSDDVGADVKDRCYDKHHRKHTGRERRLCPLGRGDEYE